MRIIPSQHKKPRATDSESNQQIFDFLAANPIGVLASVDPNGNPHASVVYFGINDDFTITFSTKRGTKKHDNLAHNNHVMLTVYEATSQTTVQITATAEDISTWPESAKIFKKTFVTAEATSEAGIPPIAKLAAGSYIAYKLSPVQIRMAVFVRPDHGGYDMYETIDFDH